MWRELAFWVPIAVSCAGAAGLAAWFASQPARVEPICGCGPVVAVCLQAEGERGGAESRVY